MKIKIVLGIAFWSILLLTGCNHDDISFDSPSQEFRFSKDTVFCDTVYNQTRSETYSVKVYNKENKDILIPKIALEGGVGSQYRINVDGKSGTSFDNVALRKNDSLYIFVEIAPIANARESIAEDKIIFNSSVGEQKITLFSVVQDAEYFIKSKTNSNTISENTTWNNDKVKVIFGDLTIAEGKTLTMEKGTKIYFHKNSGMKFEKNSVLDIQGELGKEVILRGNRSDPRFDTIPANWNGIKMEEGTLLKMNYARVFGGNTGLELKKNTAEINNSFIHTFQNVGILGIQANMVANNLVINNCGETNLSLYGGNCTLNFSTIANYWNFSSSKNPMGILASNLYKNGDEIVHENPSLKIYNSIVYGYSADMITLDNTTNTGSFDAIFSSCLLRQSVNAAYQPIGNNNILNEDPKFKFLYIRKMNLRVQDESPAKKKGSPNYNSTTQLDIAGNLRGNQPTIGAYQ